MVIAIIGILLLIVGAVSKSGVKWVRAVRIIGVIFIVLGITTSCVKQIDAGEVGVKTLFGKVQSDVLESGLHMVNPLLTIHRVDIRTQNYTMSGVHDEGEQEGDDAIRVLTSDGLEVTIDLTILYKPIASETPRLFKETGLDYKDKIVRPIVRTKIRDNAVYYEAVSLYSNKRDEFQNRIFKDIEKNFQQRGIILEQLLIRSISLPASVKKSIEDKIRAEQDAQKMEFVLQKEKQEAERKRVEAQGIADYQRTINQGLTSNQLQYEMIKAYKEMATSPNSKIIIMGNNKGTPVILDGKD